MTAAGASSLPSDLRPRLCGRSGGTRPPASRNHCWHATLHAAHAALQRKKNPLNHRRSGPSFIHPISAINSPPTSSITPSTHSARSRSRCRRHGRCHDRRHGHRRSYPASNCTKSTTLIVPRKSFAEGFVHDRFLRDSPQFHGAPHSFSLLAIRRRVRVPCARLCFAPCTHELLLSQRSRS